VRGHGSSSRRSWIATLVLFTTIARSATADWVETVFPERSFNFGTVARGSKVRHAFKVVNSTSSTIRIASWTAKCGCTDVRVGAKEIPPGTQTVIEMTLDTTKFDGPKSSGVTVNLDLPEVRQVELNVESRIRSDFTVTPGYVEFGTVLRSTHPRVTLTLNYSGSANNFQVTGMKTISAALNAELKPLGRTTTGATQYQLTADLDPQALRDGRFKDEITILTTNPDMPRVPISVAARIQSAVTLSPAVMDLKNVPAGSTKEWTVLVRAPQAFKILKADLVQGTTELPTLTEESKNLHPLKFRFTAPATLGPAHIVVELHTDIANEPPLRMTAFANVVAGTTSSTPTATAIPAPSGSN
jgi:Protein of unknown function (DUF1573)